jgi:hypothetical protein
MIGSKSSGLGDQDEDRPITLEEILAYTKLKAKKTQDKPLPLMTAASFAIGSPEINSNEGMP